MPINLALKRIDYFPGTDTAPFVSQRSKVQGRSSELICTIIHRIKDFNHCKNSLIGFSDRLETRL